MRCSSCRYISSDTHDICPRCLFDLRQDKTRLGIQIISPQESYQDLVAGLAKTKSQPKQPDNSGSHLKRLAELFGFGKSKAQVQEPAAADLLGEELANSKPISLKNYTPPPSLDELERINSALTGADGEQTVASPAIYLETTSQAATSDAQQQLVLQAIEQPASQTLEDLTQNALESLVVDALNQPEEPVAAEPEQEAPEISPPAAIIISENNIISETHIIGIDEIALINLPAEKPVPPISWTSVAAAVAESTPQQDLQIESQKLGLNALFVECEQSLLGLEPILQIGLNEIRSTSTSDEILLCFDLAEESLIDPESARRYVEKIQIHKEHKFADQELESQVAKVAKLYEQPVFSLRAGRGTSSARPSKEAPESEKSVEEYIKSTLATPSRRILAACCDLALGCGLSLVALIFYLSRYEPLVLRQLTTGSIPETQQFIGSATLLLILLPLTHLISMALCSCLTGRTFGMQLFGLSLHHELGRRVGFYNIISRILALPISWMLLSPLSVLFNQRPVHDRISQVYVVYRKGLRLPESRI